MRRDRGATLAHPLAGFLASSKTVVAVAIVIVIVIGLGGLLTGQSRVWSQGLPLRLGSGSIDGGGGRSTGAGALRLDATIGQPDSGRLQGERLTLHGGLRAPLPEPTPTLMPTPTEPDPGVEPTPTSDPNEPRPTVVRPTSVPTPQDFFVQDTIVLPRVFVER